MSHQRIVAIYLADPARSAELGACLAGDDLAPAYAHNTDELHQLVNGQRVDLLIIENQLKGFLTGLQILEHLQKDLIRPPTLMVGTSTGAAKAQAEALQIARTVEATITTEELAAAARETLLQAGQTAPAIPINLEARRLVQSSDAIQPLPQVLIKISEHLDQENTSIAELARDISLDARLTAMLLRLVNSTACSPRSRLTRVDEAVTFLGIRRCVSVVISACLIGAQKGLASKLTDSFRMWHQRRSVLIASTASAFAQQSGGLSSETAYVLGLLQDLGMLVMAHGYGEKYIQLLDRVHRIGQLRLDILEQKQFGVTHADVSAALLLKWELPASMIPLVLHHHPASEPKEVSSVERRFLHVMRIGEALANILDNSSLHRTQVLNQLLQEGGFGTVQQCKAALGTAVAKTAESSLLFSIPAPEPEALRTMLDKVAVDAQGGRETLPDSTPAEMGATGSHSACADNSPCVVIIEEDTTHAATVSQYLTAGGFTPVVCTSGAEAKSYVSHATAVLCDFPPDSEVAFETVHDLRADGFSRSIIMMSGDPMRSIVLRAIQAGISGFLPKPFTKDMLLEKLGATPAQSSAASESSQSGVRVQAR